MYRFSGTNQYESNEMEECYRDMLKADPNGPPRPFDDISRRGKFCWTKIGNVYIPVLFRHGVAVVCVHTLENEIFHNYLSCIHTDVYKLPQIYCSQATDTEAKLLNQINIHHSNRRFGSYIFTTDDILITKKDAFLYYEYLKFVFEKITTPYAISNRCGFVIINGESTVPYVVNEQGVKFVPFFYFEGHLNPLLKATVILGSWEYCYLKVCTMAQGIRSCLYPGLFTPVVPLHVVKNLFERGTTFAECHLPEINVEQLTFTSGSRPIRPSQWYLDPVDLHVFQILSEPVEPIERTLHLKQEEE